MAKKETIVDDFYKWLEENNLPKPKKQGTDNKSTRDNYKTFINQAYSYIVKARISMSPKDKAKVVKAIKNLHFEMKDFVSLLTQFAKEGDMLYTMTVYDKMFDLLCTVKKCNRTEELSNSHSAFIYLKMFLSTYDYQSLVNPIDLDKRSKFSINELHKLDGMDSLLYKLTCNGFVKLAIENSYFFDPIYVEKQVENGRKELNKARHTANKKINTAGARKPKKQDDENNIEPVTYVFNKTIDDIYIDNDSFEVKIDRDGNSYVRQLIEKNFQITVGKGKRSLVHNTIISHIWGRAYDPRFFTSFWNIVLIPAWANSLMDKDAIEGSLSSILQSTYMSICHKLYDVFRCDKYWKDLNIKKPNIKYNDDVLCDDYHINIVNKSQEEDVVLITKKLIKK